ncbi:MAG: ABC transporter permease [Firmicutes bacterium]|nr:ABC transporter permease [Bacillota bacterium]
MHKGWWQRKGKLLVSPMKQRSFGFKKASATTEYKSNLTFLLGATIVSVVLAIGLISLIWTPYNPISYFSKHILQGPTSAHLLGTDQEGRDELSRLMAGTWITLYAGFFATAIGIFFGTLIGIYVAMFRNVISEIIMRAGDILLAFPALLIATLLAARYGSSTVTAMAAVGIAFIPYVMRVTRVAATKTYNSDFVLIARSYGLGKLYIAAKHILPNIVSLVTLQTTLLFSVAILSEAGLSYLGLGTPPPSPAWGVMLSDSANTILTNPLLVLWPTLAIALTILGFNLLADAMVHRLDKRSK